MPISKKRIALLQEQLAKVLEPDKITTVLDTVLHVFDCATDLEKQQAAATLFTERRKAAGKKTYTATRKAYYEAHKEQVNAKCLQRRRAKQGRAGAEA